MPGVEDIISVISSVCKRLVTLALLAVGREGVEILVSEVFISVAVMVGWEFMRESIWVGDERMLKEKLIGRILNAAVETARGEVVEELRDGRKIGRAHV